MGGSSSPTLSTRAFASRAAQTSGRGVNLTRYARRTVEPVIPQAPDQSNVFHFVAGVVNAPAHETAQKGWTGTFQFTL
jgi:hypothetical protein